MPVDLEVAGVRRTGRRAGRRRRTWRSACCRSRRRPGSSRWPARRPACPGRRTTAAARPSTSTFGVLLLELVVDRVDHRLRLAVVHEPDREGAGRGRWLGSTRRRWPVGSRARAARAGGEAQAGDGQRRDPGAGAVIGIPSAVSGVGRRAPPGESSRCVRDDSSASGRHSRRCCIPPAHPGRELRRTSLGGRGTLGGHVVAVPPTRCPGAPGAGPAGPPGLRLPACPRARRAGHLHARAVPRGRGHPVPGHGLLLGRGEAPVAAARRPHDGGRLPGRVHAAPHVQRGLHRHDRARRDGHGGLRPDGRRHDRRAAACSGRTTTRPRACARATTWAASTAARSTGRTARAAGPGREQRRGLRRGAARRGASTRSPPSWRRPLQDGEVVLPFYYAEPHHQQYLHKNPHGYDCHAHTGILLPDLDDDPARGLPPVSSLGGRGHGGGGTRPASGCSRRRRG